MKLSFFDELKRRNVIRIAGLYLVGAWLIVQVASTVLPAFDGPGWVLRALITLLAIGFFPALIFAWAFELTPEGLKREKEVDRAGSISLHTGKKLDRVIMVVLALALGYFAFDKFVLAPQREAEQTRAARNAGRSEALVESYGDKSIAVLPFVDMSPQKDQEYFSDGISEELLNLLSKISQLRVISRSSAFSFKGKDIEIPEIAKRLNVAHILEGSVRKAGNQVRVTAQLIDARSDTNLWSETYDRPLDNIFAVQDEIAAAVVAQLKLKLLDAAPHAKATDPRAYALYLQARHLEHALALEPTNTDIVRDAAYLTRSLGRLDTSIALGEYVTARDPVNALGHANLGLTYFFAGHLDAALASSRTALSLSPGYGGAQYGIGEALLLKRDPAGALAAMQREANEVWRQIGLSMAWHAMGKKPASDAALTELIQKYEKEAAYNIAYVPAFRGEAHRAFEWLDKAVTYRDPGLAEIAVQPWFANLHQDPRWLPFLHNLGKSSEQLAAIKFDVKLPQ
jgi:TolB-like protein